MKKPRYIHVVKVTVSQNLKPDPLSPVLVVVNLWAVYKHFNLCLLTTWQNCTSPTHLLSSLAVPLALANDMGAKELVTFWCPSFLATGSSDIPDGSDSDNLCP